MFSIFKKTNAISLILSLYIIISPFLVYYFGKSPYEFPKFVFSLIIVQILAVILLFQKTTTKNRLMLLIAVFIFVNLIADILGLDPRVSLIGGEFRFQGLLLLLSGFIFALSINTSVNKIFIRNSIIISSLIISLITLLQFFTLKLGYSVPTYNGRIVATLGNPNFIGAYLAMTLPFLFFLDLKNRFIKFTLLIIVIGSIFISSSLSAVLATFIIFILYLFKIFKLHTKKIQLMLILSLTTLALLTFLLGKDSLHRYSQWDNRIIIWDAGINNVIKKPLLGVGQENFELIFPKNIHFRVDNAHNIFLETAVSSGLIGLILYLLIIIKVLKSADFKIKLSIIAFLIVGFFNPLSIICLNLFWILTGLSSKRN
jgi:O-antigen ligase